MMQTITKSSTLKKLILLISIFLFGTLTLISLDYIFKNIVRNLDGQTTNLESKISIGEFIVNDLYRIRSDFYELTTTATNFKAREIIRVKIVKKLELIHKALDILEQGGIYERTIRLNIVGNHYTTKTIKYSNNIEDISLESIDLRPKLLQLENMLDDLVTLINQADTFRTQNDFMQERLTQKKIRRFYKTTPAFFIRITENASRLLYEGSLEHKKLQKIVEEDKINYLVLEFFIISAIIAVIMYLGYIISIQINQSSKNLLKEKLFSRGILDAQPHIIVVGNGEEMIDANLALVDFFVEYESFEDFKVEHACICDYFEDMENEEYVIDKEYPEGKWYQHILANPTNQYKAAMTGTQGQRFFSITVTSKEIAKNKLIVITSLNDITNELLANEGLKELNDNLEELVINKTNELQILNDNLEKRIIKELQNSREKDKKMIQQSRYAALGEMIGNIAHQWRQPLSAISSTASSANLQIDLKIISQEETKTAFGKIMNYVRFLSQTIEDFRTFFQQDRDQSQFDIHDILTNTISLISATYKTKDIQIIQEENKNKFLAFGFPNELSQVFLNILNNSKDALINKDIKNKLVFIRLKEDSNHTIIEIYDNAQGIPQNIITKVFDPYFTTKHQSQGTGIGLYMTKDIIEKHMKGSITVNNQTFTVNNKEEIGACFTITLPIHH